MFAIYTVTATVFVFPLMADKNLGPISALICSIKAVNANIFKMLALFGIFFVLMFFVLLSFGFAYLWIGPLYFNVKAVLYQDIFGQASEIVSEHKDISDEHEDVFDA
jgi:uncharacterized membrane protein